MSDSIWKKEITFARKRKPAAAPPPASAATEPKQSVWKKEISFGRKATPAPAPAPVVAAEPKQSVWKKEISLSSGRRRRKLGKLTQSAAQSVSPDFAPEPALDLMEALALHGALPGAPASVETPAPIEPVVVQVVPAQPAPAPAAVLEVPAVGTAPVAAVPTAPPAAAPPFEPAAVAPAAVAPPVTVPEPVFAPPLSPLSPAVVAASVPPVPEPVLAEMELESEPEPMQGPEPIAPEAPFAAAESRPVEPWSAEPALPPATVEPAWDNTEWDAPVWDSDEPLAAEPEQEPELVQPPAFELELPPVPESFEQEPELVHPPAFELELPPVPELPGVEPPPEPEAELPPLPGADLPPAVPFWKKEFSLERKQRPAKASRRRRPGLPRPSLPVRRGGHMTTRVVGLKIGSSQLAAARISNNGVAELQQAARQELAPGIVVSGEVRDPGALAAALRSFFAANRLPHKGVRLGVASNRIGVRTVEVAGIENERQLANAIRFRAQEVLPIPPEEAVLDYQVLSTSVDDEGRSVRRIVLVVAHRDLVERYVDACKQAGIVLAGVDLEAFALLRSLAPPVEPGDSAFVAVAIGHERSTLAVSDGRICEFTRVLEWGGSALGIALARALDRTPSEVDEVKHALALDGSRVPAGLSADQVEAALDAVRREVRSFARELVASLQFYQAQPGSLGIGDIVITGGTTQLPGLAAELEQLVGVAVRVGNPLARLKIASRPEQTEQVGSLAVAIGLGIED